MLDCSYIQYWMADTEGEKSIFLMWDITFFWKAELINIGQEGRG